jgi:thiamine pyrophosphokinase
MDSTTHYWTLPFYQSTPSPLDKKSQVPKKSKTALIILNQPFSKPLLRRVWHTSDWRCCADGGANRLHDLLLLTLPVSSDADVSSTVSLDLFHPALHDEVWVFPMQMQQQSPPPRTEIEDYIPDIIKGDLDSLRDDVRRYYETRVSV